MARADTAGNGRQADMSFDALQFRLLRTAPLNANGNTMISVRLSDLREIIQQAEAGLALADARAEITVLRGRIERARTVLKGS